MSNMKIGIVGTHSTGKTTLVNELSKYIDLPIISEVARDFPRDITDNPEREIKRQIDIANGQTLTEGLYNDGFLSDRSSIDNSAYMINALQKYGYYISKELYVDIISRIHMSIENVKVYDYLFYIPIEFAAVSDGFRDTDEDERKDIDMIINKLLPNKIVITGTIGKRANTVLRIINDNWGKKNF